MRNTGVSITKDFASNPEVLETFYGWVEKALGRLGLEENWTNRIILATGEAFSNALMHGNRANPKKRVRLLISLSGKALRVRVGDQGEGSNHNPARRSSLFDTSGRGWEMMRKLADRVVTSRQNGYFWVELRFKMPKQEQDGQKKKRGLKSGRKVGSRSGR